MMLKDIVVIMRAVLSNNVKLYKVFEIVFISKNAVGTKRDKLQLLEFQDRLSLLKVGRHMCSNKLVKQEHNGPLTEQTKLLKVVQ